jgi:glycosyltransferase involved in cell wall biosynthesis
MDVPMPQKAQPLVSVLTPSFNQARWLPDNLASVACQTYPNIEHVVMDGGSDDGSVDVLRAAGGSVRWETDPDRGQSHALNKAFAASTGEIVGWINSDDAFYDCQVIEHVVEAFERHPEVDVVYGHAARVDAEGSIVYFMHVPRFSYERLKWSCFLVQPAVFLRRSALADGFVDESFHYAMDWELWLRLGRDHRFMRIDRVLAVDRTQPDRKIKTLGETLEADTKRLAGEYGVGRPWYFRLADSPSAVLGRFSAARFVGSAAGGLAFSGRQDPYGTIMRRQVATRLSTLPEHLR